MQSRSVENILSLLLLISTPNQHLLLSIFVSVPYYSMTNSMQALILVAWPVQKTNCSMTIFVSGIVREDGGLPHCELQLVQDRT